jgi:drug/metabolite transporter (DMT)-like permease
MSVYGEITAVLTSLCWAFTSVMFTQAGRRLGSPIVSHVRLWIAFIALCVIHMLLFGSPFPFDIESRRFFYLGVSGVVGFVVGDGLLIEAFLLIGPRLAMLLMLLAPVSSAFLAWVLLGEVPSVLEMTGILVTVGGIAWVVKEKTPSPSPHTATSKKNPQYALGIALSIGGAVGQAVGLLLSRMGLEGGYSTISANHVRVTCAALPLGLFYLLQKKIPTHVVKLKDKRALVEITGGALAGQVLGVILSLEAIAHTHIGIASTLMSLSPILLIPVSYFIFKEKISPRALIGTMVALLGMGLLFFT